MSAKMSRGRLRRIAAGERNFEFAGQPEQALHETVDPFLRKLAGQRQRKKNCEGLTSHGSDVAQAAGEAATAHDFRRMPLPAEVNAFQSKVGCHQDFVPGRRLQNRTVIADPGYHSTLSSLLRRRECAAISAFSGEGHGNHYIDFWTDHLH